MFYPLSREIITLQNWTEKWRWLSPKYYQIRMNYSSLSKKCNLFILSCILDWTILKVSWRKKLSKTNNSNISEYKNSFSKSKTWNLGNFQSNFLHCQLAKCWGALLCLMFVVTKGRIKKEKLFLDRKNILFFIRLFA